MPRPIHFDLTAENPDRAMNFYKDIFGWKFEKWDGPMEYWMITTGGGNEPGINGGLSKKGQQSMPNMNTIGVSSVDKFSKMVEDNAGKILMPKTSIPGVGWFVTCQDTEGNTFGLIEENRDAK